MGASYQGASVKGLRLPRALLKDAPLMILDEPTASLDTISENKILKMIILLKAKGKAVLLITHRESTMKIADRIMVIQDKSISENLPLDKAVKPLLQ